MLTLQPPPGLRPILVLAAGNPSRGDDALGPLLAARIEALGLPQVEVLVEFQFQVDNALDLLGRSEVYFVDAAASGDAPLQLAPAAAGIDASCSTHALSPSAVLHTAQRLRTGPLPRAWVLAIRGYEFGLGLALSEAARGNLEAAFERLAARLTATAPRGAAQAAEVPRGASSDGAVAAGVEPGAGAKPVASRVAGGG